MITEMRSTADSAAGEGARVSENSTTHVMPAKTSTGRLRNLAIQAAVLVVLVLAWIIVARNKLVTPLLVPKASAVLQSLQAGLVDGDWWVHVGTTLKETGIGFVVGILLGMIVGGLFAFVPFMRRAFYPYVVAMMSFPKIAIAPLLIVAFGYGLTPKVIIATMLAFFPVLTSASAGLAEIDRGELNLMRAIGASRWQELRYLRMPNAMSYVFPSLDVALIGALLGSVAAELIGSKNGLGYVLAQQQAYGDVAGMYGVLIVLALLGALMHVIIAAVQRLLPVSIVPKLEHK